MQLVLVEWVDSAQPIPGWAWLDEGSWNEVVTCQSVGWLVHDGPEVKALAANLGEIGGDVQVSGVIRIPVRSIVRTTYLSCTSSSCASSPEVDARRPRVGARKQGERASGEAPQA